MDTVLDTVDALMRLMSFVRTDYRDDEGRHRVNTVATIK